MLAWVVDMASRVVTPRATLAGTALWSSQKLIQDTETVIVHGTYTVTTKNDNWRTKRSSTRRQEYAPVAVITSQYWLPKAPSLKPPGKVRLGASCTGLLSFHTYTRSFFVQPSEGIV